jgi:hydroxymethylglutaryl-CoA lyase
MNLPDRVEIVEVGPRDGLQSERGFVPTEQKLALIEALYRSGFRRVEAASFVHPQWVPQMADAEEIARALKGRRFIALTPNLRGLNRAIACGVPEVAVFVGATDGFNQKNINRRTREAMEECQSLIERAKGEGMFVRAYISVAFGCPYEGEVPEESVIRLVDQFVSFGADEIDIGDTIGIGNPRQVYRLFTQIRDRYPDLPLAGHFHDTRGMAQANVLAGMQAGVTIFDASIGGLGGCPFAPGASGNAATEDLVYMLESMGIDTGIDLDTLLGCVEQVRPMTERPLPGHIQNVVPLKRA